MLSWRSKWKVESDLLKHSVIGPKRYVGQDVVFSLSNLEEFVEQSSDAEDECWDSHRHAGGPVTVVCIAAVAASKAGFDGDAEGGAATGYGGAADGAGHFHTVGFWAAAGGGCVGASVEGVQALGVGRWVACVACQGITPSIQRCNNEGTQEHLHDESWRERDGTL